MIRYTHHTQSYRYSTECVEVSEKNETKVATVLPILGATRTVEVQTDSYGAQEESSVTRLWQPDAFVERRNPEVFVVSANKTVRPRGREQLPVLKLPVFNQEILVNSPLAEAAKSGAVSSTGGAAIGAFLSFIFPGIGSVLQTAAVMGVTTGTLTAASQYADCRNAILMRSFADRCNELLTHMREHEINDEIAGAFAYLCAEANTPEMRCLLRDIVAVAIDYLGEEAAEPLRVLTYGMKIDPQHRLRAPELDYQLIPSNWANAGGVRGAYGR